LVSSSVLVVAVGIKMFDTVEARLVAVGMLMYLSVAAAVIVAFDSIEVQDQEAREEQQRQQLVLDGLHAFRRLLKRHERWAEEQDENRPPKKPKVKYDYERARSCIVQDYLKPDALFERYFEKVFRMSRHIVQQLIEICGATHSFFTETTNKITGEKGIYPEVKVLMALKVLAFGVSPVAFMDYFQMSDTSGRRCLRIFCSVISNHPVLRQKYLREMSKSDAMRVSSMHQSEFGVRGCIGCLDCMHVYWKNCPVAWKGQYEGKEGSPTIILEAVADYSLWIWHTRFGFPGTLNDINVWDQSSLLRMFLDGTFTGGVDFPFRIANRTFNKVWIMVDGIYPELSRFVKTISVPVSQAHRMYSKWQESCRKSVERAFGVLQRKFQILSRPVELYHEEDIRNVVNTCLILHNMMVEQRVLRDEEETIDWYEMIEEEGEELEVPLLLSNVPALVLKPPTVKERIAAVALQWPDEHHNNERAEAIKEAIGEHFALQQEEWSELYNRKHHYDLRDSIIQQLLLNSSD
jgi:Plant transposon protein